MFGKTKFLRDNYEAIPCTKAEALEALNDPDLAVICVVLCPTHEAAGFAFNSLEFEVFTFPGDLRPKDWLVMDRTKAKELTGYPKA